LVHGVFKVEVVNPSKCWPSVFVGQTVIVKVEAVKHMAGQDPIILATLGEDTANTIPIIHILSSIV
jgi:hypothetical protein